MIHDLNDARLAKAAAPGAAPELDDIEELSDYSMQTLAYLKQRIERSAGVEQFVYREVELDVVWRLIDCAVAEAQHRNALQDDIGALEALRAAVMDAHDLLGNGFAASEAADRLGAVLV
jgi:hypothetical protein